MNRKIEYRRKNQSKFEFGINKGEYIEDVLYDFKYVEYTIANNLIKEKYFIDKGFDLDYFKYNYYGKLRLMEELSDNENYFHNDGPYLGKTIKWFLKNKPKYIIYTLKNEQILEKINKYFRKNNINFEIYEQMYKDYLNIRKTDKTYTLDMHYKNF